MGILLKLGANCLVHSILLGCHSPSMTEALRICRKTFKTCRIYGDPNHPCTETDQHLPTCPKTHLMLR